MAQQVISIGTTNNDGTGNTLRSGCIKINANFDELNAALIDAGWAGSHPFPHIIVGATANDGTGHSLRGTATIINANLTEIHSVLTSLGISIGTLVPINIGSSTNDGTGDTIRVGFGKVNTAFSDIYSALDFSSPSLALDPDGIYPDASNTGHLNAPLSGTIARPAEAGGGTVTIPAWDGTFTVMAGGIASCVGGQTYIGKIFNAGNVIGGVNTYTAKGCIFIACIFEATNNHANLEFSNGAWGEFYYCTQRPLSSVVTAPPPGYFVWPSWAPTVLDAVPPEIGSGNYDTTVQIAWEDGYCYSWYINPNSIPENNIVIHRCDTWGYGHGPELENITANSKFIYTENWQHDTRHCDYWYEGEPGIQGEIVGAPKDHTHGIGESNYGPVSYVICRGNTIAGIGNTFAISFQDGIYRNLTITHNYLSGFGYLACPGVQNPSSQDIVFTDNKFGTDVPWYWGPLYVKGIIWAFGTTEETWSRNGNVWARNTFKYRAGSVKAPTSGPNWVAADDGKYIIPYIYGSSLTNIDFVPVTTFPGTSFIDGYGNIQWAGLPTDRASLPSITTHPRWGSYTPGPGVYEAGVYLENAANRVISIWGNDKIIQGYSFDGYSVIVRGSNTIFYNCLFTGNFYSLAVSPPSSFIQFADVHGHTFEDCEFDGVKAPVSAVFTCYTPIDLQFTLRRCWFHHLGSDVAYISGGTVEKCLVEHMGYETGSHTDGFSVSETYSSIIFSRNKIVFPETDVSDPDPKYGFTAAIFIGLESSAVYTANNDITIDGNVLLTGGNSYAGGVLAAQGYILVTGGEKWLTTTGLPAPSGAPRGGIITVTNNKLRGGITGYVHSQVTNSDHLVWSNNTNYDSGVAATISIPGKISNFSVYSKTATSLTVRFDITGTVTSIGYWLKDQSGTYSYNESTPDGSWTLGSGYTLVSGSTYQATVSGLTTGHSYGLVLRPDRSGYLGAHVKVTDTPA